MRTICKRCLMKFLTFSRMYSVPGSSKISKSVSKIKNIGIMAHIDAGKTTTTDRMLFYAGRSNHLGNVDRGDTVTDYMEQERNRGITITSAAVSFPWNDHKINLIDTPGHVDFTVEVERALRVLDGAITVLDASAGVEAQTMTVWRQANRYNVPRIAYINKMDKPGADFQMTLASIEDKLKVIPLVIQRPIGSGRLFEGVVDLVTMNKITWLSNDNYGVDFLKEPLDKEKDENMWQDAKNHRIQLIDKLAELDSEMESQILSGVTYSDVKACDILKALHRVTLTLKGLPILCGSSFKNKGVQLLMDAIIDYLPSPANVTHRFMTYYEDEFCALVFKILHDQHRGALTFLRIYSGYLKATDSLYNVNKEVTEKVGRLIQVFADEHKDIQQAGQGDIVAISGLKQTSTGDTLVLSAKIANKAHKKYLKKCLQENDYEADNADNEEGSPKLLKPVLAGIDVPEPVFFCSIEAQSLAQVKQFDHALACLQREDPSLKVKVDSDTGQTVLAGMGELHLEIIQDRMKKEYKVDSLLGPLQIAYRETITQEGQHDVTLEQTIGDVRSLVTMAMSVHPVTKSGTPKGVLVIKTPSNREAMEKIRKQHLTAINNGLSMALSQGPLLNFSVIDLEVQLHHFETKYRWSLPLISAAASQCVNQAIQKACPVLLQPMMYLEINTDENYQHIILGDLSQRKSQILDVHTRNDGTSTIQALTPLSEMMGYSTALRTISSGTATFAMEVTAYEKMTSMEQRNAIDRATGLF